MDSPTVLLERVRQGDDAAFGNLVGTLYQELRAVAHNQRRRLSASETINTTAVVHEVYARLDGNAEAIALNDRAHFFRLAAGTMRAVIIDYARSQSRKKRGGSEKPVSLSALGPVEAGSGMHSSGINIDEALTLDRSLGKLAAFDAEAARVVELRYFAGLSVAETAEALAMSPATVKRRWTFARAWLHQQMSEPSDEA
ncbi:MAG: ECF-type sigma factor [Rhodothermales bacterium]